MSSNSDDLRSIPSVDPPYTFGRRPTVAAPFPFKPREFARLLILRANIEDPIAYEHVEEIRW